MRRIEPDVAVIGAGSAGLVAFRTALEEGRRAVLVENGPYGTTCARVGCMPSKLLVTAANVAHACRNAGAFGIDVRSTGIHGAQVMARVRGERDRFVAGVLDEIGNLPAGSLIQGHARFVAPGRLMVDDDLELTPGATVIATGAEPAVPEEFRAFGSRLIVSDDVFYWDRLPERVAIFGAGPVSLEIAQALARLGVDIRVFGTAGHLGGIADPAVREYAAATLSREFYLDTDARILDRGVEGKEAVIRYRRLAGDELTEKFDYVLAGTGRRPRVRGLGLENSGLALDRHGVPVSDPATMQCGNSSVFIAGDADGVRPWLNEAAREGRIAGRNAAHYPKVRRSARAAPLAIVFSEPQIIMAGASRAALDDEQIVTGSVCFESQGRARVMNENRGLLHVYADRGSGVLLGAEGIGPRLEHLAHLLAWSVQQKLTVATMLEMPFYHPMVEEGLRTALRSAMGALAQSGTETEAARTPGC
jgi:dihydrolipoamide dehydrogenase